MRRPRDLIPHALLGLGLALGLGVGLAIALGGHGKHAAAPAPPATTAPPPATTATPATTAPPTTTAPPPVATAPPSTTAPNGLAISQLEVTSLTPFSATVAWRTTKPSLAQFAYGKADGEPTLWAPVTGTGTEHQATLSGLSFSTLYRAWITATTSDGQQVQTTIDAQTPPPASPASSTSGGAVLLDGQPFFPLMVWAACPDYQGTVQLGVNLFAATPSGCGGLQGQLEDLSGKALSAGVAGEETAASGSGLIGWFYKDEADAAGVVPAALPPVPSGISFLTLTSHFYSGAAPLPQGRSMYPGLIAKASVVGFDLYPLQGWCQADRLADVYSAQRELVGLAAEKPTFQWIEVTKMRCNGPGLAVTPQTIRAESFLAIAGGAHGLGFFPGQGWTGAAGSGIAGVAHDVQALGPALLASSVPATIEPAAGPVRVGARSYNGALYVIAVNSSRDAARATVTVRGLAGRSLTVFGEQRHVQADGDAFVDGFGPLAVHLYLVAPATS